MRNLKKFLALVLAVMMVMGLMITVDAAVNIKTNGEVTANYELAVDVLHKINVIKGGNGGVYEPKEFIQRKDFAMMLFRITTGYTNDALADTYASSAARFPDVKTTAWYAGAVGYAYSEGLMKGDDKGNFNPDDYITGLEVMTVLGRILHYGQNNELTGSSYKTEARRLAQTSGIADEMTAADLLSVTANQPVTKEAIAQMIYNTLLHDYMEYTAFGYVPATPVDGNSRTPGQLYFKMAVYEPDDELPLGVTEEEFDRDAFNRPGATQILVVDGEVVYKKPANKIASYSKGEFNGTLAKSLTKTVGVTVQGDGEDDGLVDVYYNGGLADDNGVNYQPGNAGTVSYEDFATADGAGRNGPMWLDDTHGVPGYEIEIYKHDTDKCGVDGCTVKYEIIVREAVLAQIDAIDEETGEITMSVYEVGYMQSNSNAGFTVKVNDTDDIYESLKGFKEEAYLAVYMKPNWNNHTGNGGADAAADVLEVKKLDAVKVADITKREASDQHKGYSSIIASNGKTYGFNYAAVVNNSLGFVSSGVVTSVALDAATLYLLNGFILLVDQPDAVPAEGYAYLVEVWIPETAGTPGPSGTPGTPGEWTDGEPGSTPGAEDKDGEANDPSSTPGASEKVRLLLSDNKVHEVQAKDATGSTAIAEMKAKTLPYSDGAFGALVYYTVDPVTGVYELKKIDGVVQDEDNTGALEIKKGVAEGTVPDKSKSPTGDGTPFNVEYDDNTVFFIVERDEDGKLLSTHQVVVGIDGMSNLTVDDGVYVAAAQVTNDGKADPSLYDSEGTEITDEGCVTAIVIEYQGIAAASGPAGSYFIVVSDAKNMITVKSNGIEWSVYEFEAIVNGKKQIVQVEAGIDDGTFKTDTITNGVVFVSSVTKYKSNGIIKGKTATTMDLKSAETTIVVNGVTPVTAGGNIIITDDSSETRQFRAKDMKVFLYDVTKGTVKAISASEINKNKTYNGYAVTNTDGTALLELYLTEMP